jgi:hypothetical protein
MIPRASRIKLHPAKHQSFFLLSELEANYVPKLGARDFSDRCYVRDDTRQTRALFPAVHPFFGRSRFTARLSDEHVQRKSGPVRRPQPGQTNMKKQTPLATEIARGV